MLKKQCEFGLPDAHYPGMYPALGGMLALGAICLWRRCHNRRALKHGSALYHAVPEDADEPTAHQAFFQSCTGMDDPSRAVEVMLDSGILDAFLGHPSSSLPSSTTTSEKEKTPSPPTPSWKSRVTAKSASALGQDGSAVRPSQTSTHEDEKRSPADCVISFSSPHSDSHHPLPLSPATFEVTTSVLGPTFPSSDPQLFADFSALFTHSQGRSRPSTSLLGLVCPHETPTSSFQESRRRVLRAFTQYLEEWWYLDVHAQRPIEGISDEVQEWLRVAKEEELGVEEAAGVVVYALGLVFGFEA